MGKFPSEFGGEYRLWLTNLANPAMVVAQTPPVPSPVVDTCDHSSVYNSSVYCTRPLGHYGNHQNGAATWPNFDWAPLTTPPPAPAPEPPPPPTKKWSHRK
jgi:hypothetical protein